MLMNFLKFSKDYVADFWFNVLERPLHQKIWFNVLKNFGLMFLKDHYTKKIQFSHFSETTLTDILEKCFLQVVNLNKKKSYNSIWEKSPEYVRGQTPTKAAPFSPFVPPQNTLTCKLRNQTKNRQFSPKVCTLHLFITAI